ncbi:unnamed protein product [Oikopleura dioica]|uniref:Uncharacterized protein n=1 Tax=Oikopleura dioica TaxID=34765 RepID=E4WTL9_OIKDI|nr:unnamed protein product [Oikopleura dioica]
MERQLILKLAFSFKEELDVPLEDLETAEEKNAEKQAAADAALEAVVYTSPAELLVLFEPTEPQILGLEFYQKFSFAMKDKLKSAIWD